MTGIVYSYTRRTDSGLKTPSFIDCDPKTLYSVESDETLSSKFRKVNPREEEINNTARVSNAETNVTTIHTKPQGMVHLEGGWPQAVDPNESEAKWKFAKKYEREDSYIAALSVLTDTVLERLVENNAFNLHQHYTFSDIATGSDICGSNEVVSMNLRNIFPGTACSQVRQLDWSKVNKLVVANTGRTSKVASAVWDPTYPQSPLNNLISKRASLTTVAFSVKDLNVVAAGGTDGSVQLFDLRHGEGTVSFNGGDDSSHKSCVNDIQWLTAKSGEAITTSSDGTVKVWDMRRIDIPKDSLNLTISKSDKNSLGGIALDYDPLCGPQSFLVSTQEGYVLSCVLNNKETLVTESFQEHHGPGYSVGRCPGNSGLIKSSGDWRTCLWTDGVPYPLWSTPYCESLVTGSKWNSSLSVGFFRIRIDGFLEVWDLCRQQHAPTSCLRVSNCMLTSLAINSTSSLLAVGDVSGMVYISEVSTPVDSNPNSINLSDIIEKEHHLFSTDTKPSNQPMTPPPPPERYNNSDIDYDELYSEYMKHVQEGEKHTSREELG